MTRPQGASSRSKGSAATLASSAMATPRKPSLRAERGRVNRPAQNPSPGGTTAFTHFGLSGLAMSDSLSWLDGGSGDGAFAGAVWRPPPGKRGAFLHARLVETGGRGVRVRRLGASRAGEIR